MIHAVADYPTRLNLKTGVAYFGHRDTAFLEFIDEDTGFYPAWVLLIKSLDDSTERLPGVHQSVYKQHLLARSRKRSCRVARN